MARPLKQPKIPENGRISPQLAFAQVLRERRKALGLNQTDLEGEDLMDASYISKLELGKRTVGLDGFIYLAERLGMKPSELMREVEKRLKK